MGWESQFVPSTGFDHSQLSLRITNGEQVVQHCFKQCLYDWEAVKFGKWTWRQGTIAPRPFAPCDYQSQHKPTRRRAALGGIWTNKTLMYLLYNGSILSCRFLRLSLVGSENLKNAGANSTSHFGSRAVVSLIYSLVVSTNSWYITLHRIIMPSMSTNSWYITLHRIIMPSRCYIDKSLLWLKHYMKLIQFWMLSSGIRTKNIWKLLQCYYLDHRP